MRRFGGRIRSGGTILDLACGNGRHSRYFAQLGYRVTAVDINTASLRDWTASPVPEIIEADLETGAWPLPGRRFDGILVVNYLHRPHFPVLVDTLADQGVLLFDTFAAGNERHGRPRNPEFLLQPGELLRAFGGILELVAYQHGEVREPGPAVRQRLCAIRR